MSRVFLFCYHCHVLEQDTSGFCCTLYLFFAQDYSNQKKKGSVDKTLPKSLFMGKFNMSEAAFQEGLHAGGFFETIDDHDRKAYAWSSSFFSVSETKSQGCLACILVLLPYLWKSILPET